MRKLILSLAAVAAALVVASPAQAVNAHYIGTPASGLDGANLTGSFKIAGLGDNVTISVTLSANATAQYACFNGGGNHPQASNKEVVTAPVSGTGDFTSGKNGNVIGSLTVAPPSQGDFSCPNGQKLRLTFVSYSDVQLSSVAGTVDLADQTFGALV